MGIRNYNKDVIEFAERRKEILAVTKRDRAVGTTPAYFFLCERFPLEIADEISSLDLALWYKGYRGDLRSWSIFEETYPGEIIWER